MPLPPLATAGDCERYGYDDPGGALLERASARIRAYTGQQISRGQSTIHTHAGKLLMPQRPVNTILSVEANGQAVTDYLLLPGGYLSLPFLAVSFAGYLERAVATVTYDHGFDEVPEALIELCCGIASRLSNVSPALAAGYTSEQTGAESAGFGFDSFKGISDLVSGEQAVLDRIYPFRPAFIGS